MDINFCKSYQIHCCPDILERLAANGFETELLSSLNLDFSDERHLTVFSSVIERNGEHIDIPRKPVSPVKIFEGLKEKECESAGHHMFLEYVLAIHLSGDYQTETFCLLPLKDNEYLVYEPFLGFIKKIDDFRYWQYMIPLIKINN